MNTEQTYAQKLAAQISGREYGSEITPEITKEAADNRLLIITGYSDDNIEFYGIFREEIDAYEGENLYVSRRGAYKVKKPDRVKIECQWHTNGYSWFISAEIPFAPFDIMEDGDKFCRGIVISADDLP